jgi:hypothetical protein
MDGKLMGVLFIYFILFLLFTLIYPSFPPLEGQSLVWNLWADVLLFIADSGAARICNKKQTSRCNVTVKCPRGLFISVKILPAIAGMQGFGLLKYL